ncbi:class I histocompatibility antigen, F10 alpha chain-like [Pelodiscus sinensis]|uniref:class I histocompatibility antigen, F10 alpha chain-like n=1 Tax=Pelodiscus sinensis TaxID=13735 RepID=UPI003F6AFC5E
MGPALLLLLLVGSVALQGGQAGRHSLRYFYTGVSEPGPGLPQFSTVGYVDGQPFVRYDSERGREEPGADWMAQHMDAQYWEQETQKSQSLQATFRVNLNIALHRYNHSGGLHTWQQMYGCDLWDDGTTEGFDQFAYDGRDFVSFDKDTLTWTATDAGAQVTKQKWEAERAFLQSDKNYLEQICIEWLKKYLEYGKHTLQRTEPPEVRVLAKTSPDGPTMLSCRAHGFYPQAIGMSWLKNGETRDQEMRRGGPVPNADGTYHTWATIEADPKEVDLYTCHVEHVSLLEPVDRAWEPSPGSLPIAIVVGVIAGLILIAVIIGVVVWRKKSGKKPPGYVAPGSEQGSDSSAPA